MATRRTHREGSGFFFLIMIAAIVLMLMIFALDLMHAF